VVFKGSKQRAQEFENYPNSPREAFIVAPSYFTNKIYLSDAATTSFESGVNLRSRIACCDNLPLPLSLASGYCAFFFLPVNDEIS
jgi:hypothetical protein